MALVDVGERKNGWEMEVDEKRQPAWKKVYRGKRDDLADDPAAWTLPYNIGSPWDNGLDPLDPDYVAKSLIVCKRIHAVPGSEDGTEVILTFDFGWAEWVEGFFGRTELQSQDEDGGYPSENPLDWKPKIEYGANRYQKAAKWAWDYTGTPERVAIRNSALDVFVPAPVAKFSRRTISIQRLEAVDTTATDLAKWDSVRETTNDASVTIDGVTYTVGTLFMDDVRVRRLYLPFVSGGWIWDVSYLIEVDIEDEHKIELLDQGYYKLVTGARTPILDASSAPVVTPVLLDGLGAVLTSGSDPVFFAFELYPRADWSTLSLPT